VKWNLRLVAIQRDIWRPTQLLSALQEVGFTPSLSKVASLWSGKPITVRLDDLDKICAALHCTVADLMEAEPTPQTGRNGDRRASGAPAAPTTGVSADPHPDPAPAEPEHNGSEPRRVLQ
jgi:DNA-binding Xre family transcriptional regulator